MLLLLLRSTHKRCRLPSNTPFISFSTRSASTFSAPAPAGTLLDRSFATPLLYRDFIQQSLYHPEFGYFNRPSPPVRRLAQPINFNRLVGQIEYRLELSRAYKQLQVDWLTPVEVFAPWYGRAIAHYMLELRKHDSSIGSSSPLSIVEIGGGTGTLAASILDYVCEVDHTTYSSMSYTTIEISSSLAAEQQQHILGTRGHSGQWRLVRGDASQPATWCDVDDLLPRQHHRLCDSPHTFVLMMEVMDNLPHDRVVRQCPNSHWQQVAVQAVASAAAAGQQQQDHASSRQQRSSLAQQQQQQQPHYSNLLQPAIDPLIQRCLQALQLSQGGIHGSNKSSSGGGSSNSSSNSSSDGGGGVVSWLQRAFGLQAAEQSALTDVWLPTRCLQLLDTLHAAVPQHTLIAADFDALPDIKVAGHNAPLVSGRGVGGEVQDYGSVLVPWGSADIFFPTDFDGLSQLYQSAAAAGGGGGDDVVQQHKQQRVVRCSHSSTADFMSAFAEAKMTRTLSGYNPLVQDWQNTRIFVGQAAAAGAGAAAAAS